MADTIHTVVRTDAMSGTKQIADLVSVRVYDADGNKIAVENGAIVKLGALEDAAREIYKGTLATAADALDDCVLIASDETMYDERKKNLSDFTNEAGAICRGYVLRRGNIFSETTPGFVTGKVPAVAGKVYLAAAGQISTDSTSATELGTCIAIDVTSRYTYYVIRLA